MTGDREELRDRLRVDRIGDALDPAAFGGRLDRFYTWASLRPSDADGVDAGETDGATPSASASPDANDGFDLGDWLAAGDDGSGSPDAPEIRDDLAATPDEGTSRGLYGIPTERRPDVRPVRVATVSLFVTAATLTALTAGGVLPPLGPAVGMPA